MRNWAPVAYIFTAEEKIELLKYQTFLLFETAKNKIEWFGYGVVAMLWLGIALCFYSMTVSARHYEEQQSLKEQEAIDAAKKTEQTIEKIAEISSKNSNIPASDIYAKVWERSSEFSIDPCFLLALIEKECSFKETAVARDFSKTGSLGWSQATKNAWDMFIAQYMCREYGLSYNEAIKRWPHNEKSLCDPDLSLTFICWHLNWLKANYSDRIHSLHDLYAAYNGGPGGINKASAQKNADECMRMYDKYFLACTKLIYKGETQ